MNRIASIIERKRLEIAARIDRKVVSAADVERARAALDMEFDEYVRFQELKSLAVIHNTLTLEEGQTVYVYLGNCPDTFNSQPVHVKAVLTSLFKELLERSVVGMTSKQKDSKQVRAMDSEAIAEKIRCEGQCGGNHCTGLRGHAGPCQF